MACGEDRIVSPTAESNRRMVLESGTVVVFVHWQGEGLPGKRVAVVELGIERTTNAEGIVKFHLPIGDYTMRAYDINRGGPAMLFVDEKVTVTLDAEIHVDVVDCLPCV